MKSICLLLKEKFLKAILITFMCLLSWIILTGILDYDMIEYKFNPIFLSIGLLIYILVIKLFYTKILDKLLKYKWLPYVLFASFLILSIISGIIFKLTPTWDMGTVFEIAKEYVNDGTITNTFYLAQFPNNTMMLCIDIVIMQIFKILHITDYLTGITIVTAIIISLSVIMTYYIAKKILGAKKSLMFLIIAIFTTPLYMYAAEYYTDTFSMLLTVALFYFWLILKEQKTTKMKILIQILYGIILFFAYQLKLTSAFVFIAIIIYEICNTNIKTLSKNIWVILPITVILIVAFKFIVVENLTTKEERDKVQIPTEHWIMMGMNGIGTFNDKEYAYTNQFATYKEKVKADREMIIKRITERTVNQHIKNITTKLGWAWHDGTYNAPDILRREPVNQNIAHEFILTEGQYSRWYKYIPQVMHFAMLIFIIFNIKRIIENNDYNSKDMIGIISVFGLMVFLVIWENWARYLVNMIPVMLLIQINGIDYYSNKRKNLPVTVNEEKRNEK